MLTIRAQQMQSMASASFEAWLLAHAQRHFAEECEGLGAPGTLGLIRHAVGRARWHGLSAGPDICQFVDLALVFGSDFDEGERWAAAILSAANRQASALTVALLHEAAMDVIAPPPPVEPSADEDPGDVATAEEPAP